MRRPDDVSGLYIFCVDIHMALTPLPPVGVHLSLTPLPPPCGRHKWMASKHIQKYETCHKGLAVAGLSLVVIFDHRFV